jgi:biotin synthase
MPLPFEPCIDRAEALALLGAPDAELPGIMARATAVRRRTFGDTAHLCSILNAQSGRCAEDCVFCAQSARHHAPVECYPLRSSEEILAAHTHASRLPVERFGIVTSGKALDARDVERLCALIAAHRDAPVSWCASLGILAENQLARLRAAGLRRFHHNLETAESHFARICTTHTYSQRVATIEAAQRAGLEVCAGGILGMGETRAQRVELAFALAALGVESVPLNFLVPIPGTPGAAIATPLAPEEILAAIVMFRLVCPRAELKICAGREHYLGDREKDIFAAGATGIMIGGYLTVRGRSVEDDLAILREAGMQYGSERVRQGA